MTEDPKRRFDEVRQEIDLRLDGLLGELGRSLTEVLGRLDDGQGEIRREHNFQSGDGGVRASAGLRVRVGGLAAERTTAAHAQRSPARQARAAEAGDMPQGQPSAPAARDIAATVLMERGLWSLSADLPGMTERDVTLSEKDGRLVITAASRGRRYEGTFDKPVGLALDDISLSVRNGILDLTASLPEDTE